MSSPRYEFTSDVVRRLFARDGSLFSADAAIAAEASAFMGWTRLARDAEGSAVEVSRIAAEVRAEGLTDVVLLGMGGSSLASLVIGALLGPGSPRLHVVDTTSPVTVSKILADVDPASTIFIVSSKSGSTIEPNALYAIFRARADERLGRDVSGSRFIAITDPGSSLEALAARDGFRGVVASPPDVGGRYSALTVFGLLPAALLGIEPETLLAPARELEAAYENGEGDLSLASFIAGSYEAGADKLTLVVPPEWIPFGLWVEQLVAESLGKSGRGIVPVIEYGEPGTGYGSDRAVVTLGRAVELDEAIPVLDLGDAVTTDLGRLFVLWECSVALAGVALGVNPFDQPNVAEAKAATSKVLDGLSAAPLPDLEVGEVALTYSALAIPSTQVLAHALKPAIDALGGGDYLALLGFLPDDYGVVAPLIEAVPELARRTGCAVTPEIGPRYLHSTGQLHKGGPDSGVFIVITTRDATDLTVPGQPWTLHALHRAQAEGDFMTLAAHGRRAVRVDLPDASADSVRLLAEALLG